MIYDLIDHNHYIMIDYLRLLCIMSYHLSLMFFKLSPRPGLGPSRAEADWRSRAELYYIYIYIYIYTHAYT